MRAHALDEVGELLRHLTAVIDTAHHRILKADAAARLLLVAAAGRDQLLQRERIVDRHHAGTGLIVRRMERDRQCQLQMALRQLVDLGHKAAGRQADVAHTDVDALRAGDDLQKVHHIIKIVQRLTDAHQNNVGDALAGVLLCGVNFRRDLPAVRSRTRPAWVEAQNRQPIAQPTWVDTQTVLPYL